MIGGLKEKAKEKAMETLKDQIAKTINQNNDIFNNIKLSDVKDDVKYNQYVVNPLWTAVKIQSGGAISVAQKFVDVESKFKDGLFTVRDKLIVVEGEKVKLNPDFSQKLVPILMESFK